MLVMRKVIGASLAGKGASRRMTVEAAQRLAPNFPGSPPRALAITDPQSVQTRLALCALKWSHTPGLRLWNCVAP